MTGRLRHIIAKLEEHFVSDLLLVVDGGVAEFFPEQRICVPAVPAVMQIKGLMVYAGTEIINLMAWCADPICKHLRGMLHTVAQAGDIHVGIRLHRFAEHTHRVRIVEKQGVRAEALNIPADIQHKRNVPQRAENAADTARVSDVHADTKLIWNIHFQLGNIRIAVENCADYTVCTLKRSAPVRCRRNVRRNLHCPDNLFNAFFCICKTLFINVHQAQFCVPKVFKVQQIHDKIPGKNHTACADKCEFFHI